MTSEVGRDSQSKTIAVVGFSVRAAAQLAKRAGFEVVAVDACADRDLICDCRSHIRLDDPNWPNALNTFYPLTPLLLTGGMEHRTQMLDVCHSVAIRRGSTASQLHSMRSLENWEKWVGRSGLGWPLTFRTLQDVKRFEKQNQTRDWLMKPFESGGGFGTTDLFNTSPLADFQSSDQARFYFQERLPGVTIGVTFLTSEFGSSVVGTTEAWKPDSKIAGTNYAYCGSYGPIALIDEQLVKLHCFANIAGNESGLLGLWQADFLMHLGELTLLEINPRWSASMDILDVCLDLCLVEMHYACICMSMRPAVFRKYANSCYLKAQKAMKPMLGKLIVYADDTLVVTRTQSDEWWLQRWTCDLGSVSNRCQFADIPSAGTEISIGHPILTVLTTGTSMDSILYELQVARSKVLKLLAN